MHAPQQKKPPEDFFSKLDQAVSNLENLRDDMLVDVPEVTPGSDAIANHGSYAPNRNDDTSPIDVSNAANPHHQTPNAKHLPNGDASNSVSTHQTGEVAPHPQIPSPKSKATTIRDLRGPTSHSQLNAPSGQPVPILTNDLEAEGPSHLLPDELRVQLPGVDPTTSTSANQPFDCSSDTSSPMLTNPRATKVPARTGILTQDPWLNALLAIAIAAATSIYPAWEAGRRLHNKIVTPLVTELQDAISRPLAVQDNTLRKPAAIALDVRTNYNKIQQRYYIVWLIALGLIGLPLALLRRKKPQASDITLN